MSEITRSEPEIYGEKVYGQEGLRKIQFQAREKLAGVVDYEKVIESLKAAVNLEKGEKYINSMRTVQYATNKSRGGNIYNKDGIATWSDSCVFYDELVKKIEGKPGYMPPMNKDQKVIYDICFRLRQLGFPTDFKHHDKDNKITYDDDFAIAIMAFQKMAGLKRIEGIAGPETLSALTDDALLLPALKEKLQKKEQTDDLKSQIRTLLTSLGFLDVTNTETDTYEKAVAAFKKTTKRVKNADDISEDLLSELNRLRNLKQLNDMVNKRIEEDPSLIEEKYEGYANFLMMSILLKDKNNLGKIKDEYKQVSIQLTETSNDRFDAFRSLGSARSHVDNISPSEIDTLEKTVHLLEQQKSELTQKKTSLEQDFVHQNNELKKERDIVDRYLQGERKQILMLQNAIALLDQTLEKQSDPELKKSIEQQKEQVVGDLATFKQMFLGYYRDVGESQLNSNIKSFNAEFQKIKEDFDEISDPFHLDEQSVVENTKE